MEVDFFRNPKRFLIAVCICLFLCETPVQSGSFRFFRIDGTEEALRVALDSVAFCGGGKITFASMDTTVCIKDRIYFYGNRLLLDGEDRHIVLKYIGPDSCNQTEGQDHFIEIHGDSNVIRNFTLIGFPDGIHVQRGYDNIVENISFPAVCEDAVTNNGRGYEAFRTLIRNCHFNNSEDKAVMINNGGSVTVDRCEFMNCMQPVRAGGKSGHYEIRNCTFKGSSTGPRFSGGEKGMTVIFENNTVFDSEYGFRIYGQVQAIIGQNVFRHNQIGVLAYDSAGVRVERNAIQGATEAGILLKGSVRADLGSGRVSIGGDDTPSQGFNILKGNTESDLVNRTGILVKAENNIWDHSTVAEVLSLDVEGLADIDPIH